MRPVTASGHWPSFLWRAIAAGRRALQLDPLSMISHVSLGTVLYFARDYEESIVYFNEALELAPDFDGAHTDLARSYEELGRFDEALAEYEEGSRLTQDERPGGRRGSH